MTIEGIPDGWELIGVRYACEGECFLSRAGKIERWVLGRKSDCVLPIVRKIEKPKQYRPFANAAEYKPHRCRWVSYKSNPDSCMRIDGYGNNGVTIQGCVHDFDVMFEDCTFDDGTPFGIEVTE